MSPPSLSTFFVMIETNWKIKLKINFLPPPLKKKKKKLYAKANAPQKFLYFSDQIEKCLF